MYSLGMCDKNKKRREIKVMKYRFMENKYVIIILCEALAPSNKFMQDKDKNHNTPITHKLRELFQRFFFCPDKTTRVEFYKIICGEG